MRNLLLNILQGSAPRDAFDWLVETSQAQEQEFQKRPFYYAFSGVSRHFPKRDKITLTKEQEDELSTLCPGLSLAGWDQFRLARVILLLTLAKQDKAIFLDTIHALLNTADLREQTAIYSAFPLLPHQAELIEYATDGLRSNIVDVFDSIALGNPFPAAHFTDAAWNQMVLKALFISRPLYRIEGFDRRANAELAEAASYLAHERWAAGRWISPEAWRSCVKFPPPSLAEDLRHLVDSGDAIDREAAALVLATSPEDACPDLREQLAEDIKAVEAGSISWNQLGEKLEFPTTLNGSPAQP